MTEAEFLALIDQHRRVIHNLCSIHRDSSEDRKDLFQDIVFELWKSRDSFQGKSSVSTWIYSVAFNTATTIYYLKEKPKVVHLAVMTELADSGDEWMERRGELFQAMRYLNNDEKAILTLYMEQLSYEEIATIAGISVSNVGARVHRIKTKIRNILKDR